MGSYPMRDGVHDFNADETNKYEDTRKFEGSGLKAGVEDGLGSVEAIPRGNIEAEQKTVSNVFRQEFTEEPGGSKNGKSFTITR